uniref:UDP-N-acetylglucosamine transporter n=1 Tax=Strongyloides papillosus TaxID=174720 RepID=A0A0N5BG64_STREA
MGQENNSNAHKNLKWISLIVLILQTTALVLTLRYSRTQKTDGPRYISSTAVLVSEIVKFFTCIVVIFLQNKCNFSLFKEAIDKDIIKKPFDTLKVGVPAVLYVIQNNLLFLALSKLDAATYQVTYQLKILTTAFFSVALLKKKLDIYKWFALILLTGGVALVQMPSGNKKGDEDGEHSVSDHFIGLFAVLAACFSSGFAGVYFEKILKGSVVTLWVRNLQLAFFSIFGGYLMVWLYDWDAVSENGFFQGYSGIIWCVVALQAYGGLVIALVVKYADNILKGFAVSLSIILSSLMSYLVFNDFTPSLTFAAGASIVIMSTFLYGYEPKKKPYIPLTKNSN